jgi:hypothetical protein
MNEPQFLEKLQQQAKSQAAIEQSSPLPVWSRPFFSVIGMHYWQFLFVISGIVAIGIAIWFFPSVYENYYRL